MTGERVPEPILVEAPEVRRFRLSAGAAYGLVFGLSFGLLAWGRDAWLLALNGAELAWAKLLLGIPLAMAISCLVGWLSARSSSTLISVVLWAVGGGLLGWLAGHMPYDGNNLAAWLVDQRLRWLTIFPYGRTAAVIVTLVSVAGVGIGALVGVFENFAIDSAWNQATSERRMSVRSWIVLLVCIPWVFLFTWPVEELINRPLREPQQTAGELVRLVLSGGNREAAEVKGWNYSAIESFVEKFSQEYVIHLAEYRVQPFSSGYTDIAFDNGFVLRCATANVGESRVNHRVTFCIDFSQELGKRMDDLVHAGLYSERRWLAEPWQKLLVSDEVMMWLTSSRGLLSETYEVSRTGQRGGWVFASARFDTGFEMTCRFQGIVPLMVDQCQGSGLSPALMAELAAETPESSRTDVASLPGVETVPLADLAPSIPWLPSDASSAPAVTYCGFNATRPPFDDRLVRQAFSLAVDRHAAVTLVFRADSERAPAPQTFILPGPVDDPRWRAPNIQAYITNALSRMSYQRPRTAATFTHPDVLGRDLYGAVGLLFEPDRARALLAQAGYPNGEGFPQITLAFYDTEMNGAIVGSIATTWRDELGVDVRLAPADEDTYLGYMDSGEVDVVYGGWITGYNDPDGFLMPLLRLSDSKWLSFDSAEFGGLVDQAAAAADDPARRQKLYIEAERILCEQEAIVAPILHHYVE